MPSGSSGGQSSSNTATKDCPRCRTRRIPCDRTLPGCRKCAKRNFVCPGYGVILRWGQGVASRGRLTGRSLPVRAGHESPGQTLEDPRPHPLVPFIRASGVRLDSNAISSELLHHFDRYVAPKLAWVDGPANPWRNVILPLSHVSPTVFTSVLAIAAQDLAYKYATDHPHVEKLQVASLHYLGQALSSLGQQLGTLLGTPSALVSASQARCVLASTLLLYNLELLTAEAARWQTHIRGARAIIQQVLRYPHSLEEADVFLFYEYYYTSVFISLTTFDPPDGIPDNVPRNDHITIFSDFFQIMHSVTTVERLQHTCGPDHAPALRIEDVETEIEAARDRTLELSNTIQFSSPDAQRDFPHLTQMYYHSSLIYSHRVLSDGISSKAAINGSRDAILDHLIHITRCSYFVQDLVWPLFIAGTECRGLPTMQETIERAMLGVMRASGSLDRRRVLSFLKMFWQLDLGQEDVNWIHLARTMSAGCGFLIL